MRFFPCGTQSWLNKTAIMFEINLIIKNLPCLRLFAARRTVGNLNPEKVFIANKVCTYFQAEPLTVPPSDTSGFCFEK